mmetsp:Transcript_74262/g.86189  ORF Transcript_74262/g.86189 Transcript_74262/m.86189 type:complete len:125 (+) Transcript_74262:25-399(+)|eukprot:CAMPEP_0176449858 /NCGR_PEP_ID=MMETSP0127-20121128/26769_1 /TAXON_ID=938130 /ORGANISM="Platyophrya macrostoma, Strain WH" /LENGTH=124 /DNA_ID=CAMNT_0017837359 /DNA_START=25 /DNA_END=399 /DNA_ORIENTATION=-
MLRRTSASLFKSTPVHRAGGGLYHPLKAEEVPSAELTKGFFCKLNGPLSILRVIDIKWMMNRCVDMHREHYIATPLMLYCIWQFVWGLPQSYLWGDAKPPRDVDWNKGKAGFLPEGFVPTEVKK